MGKMRDTLNDNLNKIRLKNRRQSIILIIILTLSVVVSLDVFMALRRKGITMAGNASCGIEEHTHTDECFNSEYRCQKQEHVHDVNCYSDETADVETQLDWQESVARVNTTGDFKTDLVKIAKTQLGYSESMKNFQTDGNGERHGYTRYGAWYGMPYSDWSSMFVSFCMNYAGSDASRTPFNLGAESMRLAWDNKAMYMSTDLDMMQEGDILFIDDNKDGAADKVGIVTQTTALYVNTIEGDVSDSVSECTYKKDDATLMGYGTLPPTTSGSESASVSDLYAQATPVKGLTQNTVKDAFVNDSAYSKMYNADSPLGTAGSFHIVAFDTAYLKVHTNGNVLAKNVYANSNFGARSQSGVDLLELSYIQNYRQVNSGSAADTTDYLVIGSSNTVTLMDNGNAFAVNGTKLDTPKKSNIIQDADTEKAPFIDLVRVENEIKSIANQLASYKNSDSSILEVKTTGTSPYLRITNKNNTGIYTFTAAEIVALSSNGNGLSMKGFETGGDGAIIVNVDCANWDVTQTLKMPRSYVYVDGKQVDLAETLDFSAGKVLWNFINTKRSGDSLLKIETNLMTGAVIAPDAHINLVLSYNGTAIGKVVENNSETHRTDYVGKIIPTGEVGGAYIDINKVDNEDAEIKLSGAEYTLYSWDGNAWKVVTQNSLNVIQTTNSEGMAYFKGLTYNIAYMLKETKAPNGYNLDETPYYFYFESTDTVNYPVMMPTGFKQYSEKNTFSHTFTNIAKTITEYATLKINKSWKNASGHTEIPENVKMANFELWRVSRTDTSSAWGNAEKIYDNIILSSELNWTWQAGDKELLSLKVVSTATTYYAYYIVETSAVEGYTPSYDGISASAPQTGEKGWLINVINHKVETTSLDIVKEWYDLDGKVMTKPPVPEIYVQLYASSDNGNSWTAYGNTRKITADNNWKLTVTNLPVKNPETGTTYSYTIREFAIDNFESEVKTNSDGSITISNTCKSEFVSVKVDKKWLRNGNYINKSSGEVEVELYQISGFGSQNGAGGGQTVDVLVKIGHWYYDDKQYQNETYSVAVGTKMKVVYDFAPADNGYELFAVVNGSSNPLTPVSKVENGVTSDGRTVYKVTYEFIVTSNTSLQGKLNTWVNTYNHSVTVLYEEPLAVTTSLYKTVTLNSGNNWTHQFGNLPKYAQDENGKTTGQYHYYVVEKNSEEYSPVYTDSFGKAVNEENPIKEGTIIIENTVTGNAYELPGTGGKGITLYILAGAILVACTICCVYIKKYRKGVLT